ncbi:MAG: hypothetical protein WC341_05080 [Bacteroidales bacterium]|jgi:hypothetical protein
MIDAIKLEWLKVRNYRVFWILMGMYLLTLTIIAAGGVFFLEWLKSLGTDFNGIDPTIVPIYDFPDIWQNMTYLGSFAKILLAFVVIISVNNDVTYNTLRQNIIDGISKRRYLLGKLMLIIALATISTLYLFFTGMITGSIYSHVWEARFIFDKLEFLAAYFFDIVVYCSLAFLLSLLIKKAGFVIVLLFLYTLIFEPIAGAVLTNAPIFRDSIWSELVAFFPIQALNNLITVPFGRYVFMEIQDYIPLKTIAIAAGWLIIYLTMIITILTKRDMK